MKKNARRRQKDDSSDEEEEGVKKKTLAELREEQKQRKARQGIQAACTFDKGQEDSPKKKTAEEEAEEELEKQRSIGEMMESSFTGMRYVRKDDSNPHEKIMEQYINEKLGKKKAEAEVEPTLPGSKLTRRDKLMMITEEINALGKQAEKPGFDGGEGVGEGAPIAYSTGIAEVSLPIEFKMKNIEATERARKEMEAMQKKGKREEPIVGNLTTNYNKFRRDYAIEMRAKDAKGRPPEEHNGRQDQQPHQQQQHQPKQQQQPQRNRGVGEAPSGREVMTDDQVYDRFKKRTRR